VADDLAMVINELREMRKETKASFETVVGKLNAIEDGLLLIGRKLLAEPEVRELQTILQSYPAHHA
jgi:hypothetical protein